MHDEPAAHPGAENDAEHHRGAAPGARNGWSQMFGQSSAASRQPSAPRRPSQPATVARLRI